MKKENDDRIGTQRNETETFLNTNNSKTAYQAVKETG